MEQARWHWLGGMPLLAWLQKSKHKTVGGGSQNMSEATQRLKSFSGLPDFLFVTHRLANRLRMSIPRSKIESSAEKLKRKCVSRRLKVFPGMVNKLLRIAWVTKSVPVPQRALRNK